ncbi:hypothetical protein [Hymenobacter koreensis]|uniref:Uncharacterized protein n=1 Tax=Hymenobacter koreensis TaxID=1084523 RepID=A0ABP8JHG8_9BACT
MFNPRTLLFAAALLGASACAAQSIPESPAVNRWQIGLRAGLSLARASVYGTTPAPNVRYASRLQSGFAPAVVVQRQLGQRTFGRATFSTLALPAGLEARVGGPRYSSSSGYGFGRAKAPRLHLEAGYRLPLGQAARTRLLAAVGTGVVVGGPRNQNSLDAGPADSASFYTNFPVRLRYVRSELRRVNAVVPGLSGRLGLEREMRWRDVIGLEVGTYYGLLPLYRTRHELELIDETTAPATRTALQAATNTHGSFVEVGLSYRWQPGKRAAGLTPLPRTRTPWQPLPGRGLYTSVGMHLFAHLARARRTGFNQTRTLVSLVQPGTLARLGYQWPNRWLVEAGVQTGFVPLVYTYDVSIPAPAVVGASGRWGRADVLNNNQRNRPGHRAALLQAGRRWALRPHRVYAAAKAGVQALRYTGRTTASYSRTYYGTNASEYSPLQFAYETPARWRLLACAEAEAEVRISRRTLLGLHTGYALRPVGRAGADRLTISWQRNGQPEPAVEVVSRMAHFTGGLQLRRVLHL